MWASPKGSRRVIEPAQEQMQKPRIRHRLPGLENVNAGKLEDTPVRPRGKDLEFPESGGPGKVRGSRPRRPQLTVGKEDGGPITFPAFLGRKCCDFPEEE